MSKLDTIMAVAAAWEGGQGHALRQQGCCVSASRVATGTPSPAPLALPSPPAAHFHWLSFLAFAGSVVFEGVRVVMTEKLLGQVGCCRRCHAACGLGWCWQHRVLVNMQLCKRLHAMLHAQAREHTLLCCPILQARYNVMEALVYLGPFTTAFLAAGAFAFEWDQGLATTVGLAVRLRPRSHLQCTYQAPDASHSSVAGT